MMPRTARLRVLMVTARYPPYAGGIETHVAEVSRHLVGRGFGVTVLTTMVDPLPAHEEVDGVTIMRVRAHPRNRDYYFAPGLWRHITDGSHDLVHLQGYHNLVAPLTMAAAACARVPYVVSFHSGGPSSPLRRGIRRFQRLALRPGLMGASRLIAVAESEVELFSRSLHLARDRFTLVRNGSSMPQPQAEPDPERPLVLSIGRLERYKGHHRLIDAWPHVLGERPRARLRILGTGSEEVRLHAQVARLALGDAVEITSIPPGDRQAMANAIGRAHLVALISEYEAHPVAVLEALAVGRRALVARSSGLAELADAGLVAGVAPDASPGELATAVLTQLALPPIEAHPELPTWEDCADDLGRVYRAIAQR